MKETLINQEVAKFIYLERKSEILSPNQWFDDCGKFRNGFAIVELDDKYNYINTKGEISDKIC